MSEFRISQMGRYKTRAGDMVIITSRLKDNEKYDWAGYVCSDDDSIDDETWMMDGRYIRFENRESSLDIVSQWRDA